MNREDIIRMAREAGIPSDELYHPNLERFAALVAAEKEKRADALAATIVTLRDIVTNDAESKADFIARVRNVLESCPDLRVLYAVEAEREACAKVCEDMPAGLFSCDMNGRTVDGYVAQWKVAEDIRARGETK